jgi:hypothetical protein
LAGTLDRSAVPDIAAHTRGERTTFDGVDGIKPLTGAAKKNKEISASGS